MPSHIKDHETPKVDRPSAKDWSDHLMQAASRNDEDPLDDREVSELLRGAAYVIFHEHFNGVHMDLPNKWAAQNK